MKYERNRCDDRLNPPWLPRSVWWMQPIGGDRNAMAMFSALIARSCFIRWLTTADRALRHAMSREEPSR